jgi:hypothetical protein
MEHHLIAKLNTGEIVALHKDNEEVRFAPGKWSLIGYPFELKPGRQHLKWVPTTAIAKRFSVSFSEIGDG